MKIIKRKLLLQLSQLACLRARKRRLSYLFLSSIIRQRRERLLYNRHFHTQMMSLINTTFTHVAEYFSKRDPVIRRYRTLPRPQGIYIYIYFMSRLYVMIRLHIPISYIKVLIKLLFFFSKNRYTLFYKKDIGFHLFIKT